MPFGGIERAEQPVSQATIEARELARQEQAQFMADYKAGRLNPTPFPNLAPITEAFDAARRAQAALVLSDEQREACQALLREAAVAIRSAKAEDFGFALGPNLASCKRKYAEDTCALYWQYLSLLTQLAIAGRREATLLEFAKQQNYPREALSAQQQSHLRVMLSEEFNPDNEGKKFTIPDAWGIEQEFIGLAQHESYSLFEQEHKKIQGERNTTNLPVALRQVKQESEKLKNKISALKARLDELAKADAVLMENDAQASWKLFRESYAGRRDLEQRVQTLKESGLPLVSLTKLQDEGESLLELAAEQYGATQDPACKAALRRIMDTLASHGSKVVSEAALRSLDFQALNRVLVHAPKPTPRIAAAQTALVKYVAESADQLASWWWVILNGRETKMRRCLSVQAITRELFLAPEREELAICERRVLTAVQRAQDDAKGGNRSGLFVALHAARTATGVTQPLLSPTGDTELKGMPRRLGYGTMDQS